MRQAPTTSRIAARNEAALTARGWTASAEQSRSAGVRATPEGGAGWAVNVRITVALAGAARHDKMQRPLFLLALGTVRIAQVD
jgi:hypothetical protein